MNLPTKGILFDLDGTLLDTAPDFILSLNQLRHEYQLPSLAAEEIRAQVSNGARALIQLGFNIDENDAQFTNLRDRLLQIYQTNIAVHTKLFPGLDHLLNYCNQYEIAWGIVTNKPHYLSVALIKQLELHKTCHCLICPEQVTHRKPHPESLFKACETLKLSPQECVYIGDHSRDIEAGRAAGMATIAALYGYIESHIDPQSWQATAYAQQSTDLFNLLFPTNTP